MSSAQQCAWVRDRAPGAVRAGQGARGGRAVRARRRDVGRVRHQHGRRRGDGAAVPASASGGSRSTSAIDMRRGVAAGLVRLHRRAAADRHAGRLPVVPHAEDLLEHHQRLPAPHVLVGGHRRHAGVHALPAGRHLHRRADRSRARPRRAQLPRQGRGDPVAGAVRARRRRRRADPRDARPRARVRRTWPARRGSRSRRRATFFEAAEARVRRRRRSGRASSTWRSTAAPTPRRPR